MKRIVPVALLALAIACPVAAQEPSPEGSATGGVRMAWADFEALVTEWAQPSDSSEVVATVGSLLVALDAGAEKVQIQAETLEGIVPEPCYTAAHAKLEEWLLWARGSFHELRPTIEEQTSLEDALSYVGPWVEEGQALFPELHVDDEGIAPGYRTELTRVLSLADCSGFPTEAPG